MSKNESKLIAPYKACVDDFTLGDKEIITSWIVPDGTNRTFRVSVILGNNRIVKSEDLAKMIRDRHKARSIYSQDGSYELCEIKIQWEQED